MSKTLLAQPTGTPAKNYGGWYDPANGKKYDKLAALILGNAPLTQSQISDWNTLSARNAARAPTFSFQTTGSQVTAKPSTAVAATPAAALPTTVAATPAVAPPTTVSATSLNPVAAFTTPPAGGSTQKTIGPDITDSKYNMNGIAPTAANYNKATSAAADSILTAMLRGYLSTIITGGQGEDESKLTTSKILLKGTP